MGFFFTNISTDFSNCLVLPCALHVCLSACASACLHVCVTLRQLSVHHSMLMRIVCIDAPVCTHSQATPNDGAPVDHKGIKLSEFRWSLKEGR